MRMLSLTRFLCVNNNTPLPETDDDEPDTGGGSGDGSNTGE